MHGHLNVPQLNYPMQGMERLMTAIREVSVGKKRYAKPS